MKKIAIVANSCWYVYNFRRELLRAILYSKYQITIIAPYDNYTKLLEEMGFSVCLWDLKRSSINPINELSSILNLVYYLNREKPDLVHNFTIKSCLYGMIASRLCKVKNIINSITGLGHLFLSNSIKMRIIRILMRPLYIYLFNLRGCYTIFQNIHDQRFLKKFAILRNINNSFLIEGSGVDIDLFHPKKNNHFKLSEPLKLLFPSRIIREKGFEELLIAYASLLKKDENIELYIAGEIDEGNRSSLVLEDKKNLSLNKKIKFLGHSSNMEKVYSECDIVILPSWREGLSRSLIEAGAMGKAIITTDVPGCRDVVDHGINGILIPVKDPKAIESAVLFIIKNKNIAKIYGKNIRKKVEKKFDVKIINRKTINIYNQILDS